MFLAIRRDPRRHDEAMLTDVDPVDDQPDQATDVKTAQRVLPDLARRLETEYPSAAENVREGLDETLTVLTLKLSPRLRRSLATTNPAESLISRTRLVKRNVKRWRGGDDDAALGGRRCPRSRKGLSSAEGVRRYAHAGAALLISSSVSRKAQEKVA
jgi:hypothetical protein